MRRLVVSLAALATRAGASAAPAQTLKVVMHSDVKARDPMWSGA